MSTKTVRICDLCGEEKTPEIVAEVVPGVDVCMRCLLNRSAGDLLDAIAKNRAAKEKEKAQITRGEAMNRPPKYFERRWLPTCGHVMVQPGCASCDSGVLT